MAPCMETRQDHVGLITLPGEVEVVHCSLLKRRATECSVFNTSRGAMTQPIHFTPSHAQPFTLKQAVLLDVNILVAGQLSPSRGK